MKNLPYYKGGTCKKEINNLSFKGNLKELQFTTYEDFCKRADIILYTYLRNNVDSKAYKEYIYSRTLNENEILDRAMKDKCYEWLFDNISTNDLYSLLGMAKRGNK